MRVGVLLGLVVLALASVGVAAANEPPLASAGLDQEGTVNTTVYLDAGGSLDPDGSIADYEWVIETPNGSTVTANCRRCSQTWFVPRQEGQYDVTIRVTDEDGATGEDTLYVDVGSPPPQPSPSRAQPSAGGSGGIVTGSTGGGGSGGSGSVNAYLVEENGQLYISGSPNTGEIRIPVDGGRDIVIGGEEFRAAQARAGRAPVSAFRTRLDSRGLSNSEIRSAIEAPQNSCATFRGSDCTESIQSSAVADTASDSGSGESGADSAPNSELSVSYGDTESSANSKDENSNNMFDTVSDTVESILDGDDSNGDGSSDSSITIDSGASGNPGDIQVNVGGGDEDDGIIGGLVGGGQDDGDDDGGGAGAMVSGNGFF